MRGNCWFKNHIFFFRHNAAEKFYIEPRDPKHKGEKILEIDRVSQELVLTGKRQCEYLVYFIFTSGFY
jgi:hypothetical protein